MSIETIIKTVEGECDYLTVQEFGSVEDAYQDKNPLTELQTKIVEIKSINKKYKLKKDERTDNNTDSNIVSNNSVISAE